MKANAKGGKNISFPEKHAARFRFCFRNDMRLARFQRVRGLDAEWKLLRCPTKYCLPANAHIVGRRTGTPLTASVGDTYISGRSFTSFVRSPVPYHSRTFDLESVRLRAIEATQRAGIAFPHAEGDWSSGVTRDGEASAFISVPAAVVGGVPLTRAMNPWAMPEASV